MAIFNVTASINWDQFGTVTPTGADTYNIQSGSTLTIDTDSRYCNGRNRTNGVLGSVDINPSTGGVFLIDGTRVKLIPFDGGAGTVPAATDNILVTQTGGVTGTFLGIWNTLNNYPLSASAAMSASGWIKIKNVTGTFVSGTAIDGLTGCAATASGPMVNGWIEVPASDGHTARIPRLGSVVITGAWFDVGDCNGVAGQTLQLPASQPATYGYAGVWIETASGSGIYEIYANGGTSVTPVGTDDRGKSVIISSQGLLTVGGANLRKLPASGSKIRVPNVLLINTASGSTFTNTIPNATLTSRYTFITTGSGDINMQMCNVGWAPNFAQPYTVKLTNVGILSNITVSEVAAQMAWDSVVVGQEAATINFGLTMTSCFAGGSINDCTWTSTSLAATGRYVTSITNIAGFTWNRNTYKHFAASRGGGTTGCQTITNPLNCTWSECVYIGGRNFLTTAIDCLFTKSLYADKPGGLTDSANAMYVFDLATKCNNVTIDGIAYVSGTSSFPPYSGFMNVNQCDYIKLRNIGSPTAVLTCSTTGTTTTGVIIAHAGNSSNIEVKRVYVTGTRTGLNTAINSDKNVLYENVWADHADIQAVDNLNFVQRGIRAGAGRLPGGAVAVYGTHFADMFYSDTQGKIYTFMNEPTAETVQYVSYSLAKGSGFASNSSLLMKTAGDVVEWTWPYYIKGYTGLANTTMFMSLTGAANFTTEYDLDKGSGFTGYRTGTSANIGAETGILSGTGFKPKFRLTCTTSSIANSINGFALSGTTTAAAQRVQYPLDTVSAVYTMTGIKSGSEVRVYNSATNTELTGTDSILSSPTGSFAYSYTWDADSGNIPGIVVIHALGWQYQRFEVSFGSSSNTIPIQQVVDRQFENPPGA